MFSLFFIKTNLEGGGGVSFVFPSLFVTLLLFESFLLFFVYSWRGKGGHEFYFILLLFLNWGSGCGFYFFTFCYFLILEGGRGAWVFFIFLHLKRGGGCGLIYLLFFWLIFYYLYSFVTFLRPEEGRVAWVLLFFVLCVKLLLPFFTLAGEEGVGFFFFFLIIILYFKIFYGYCFTFWRAKGGTRFLKTC